jgi:hypothetical protein
MSDSDQRDPQSGLPPGGLDLGGLGADDVDRTLGEPAAAEPPEAPADPERLALPRSALVAFRKSGGFRFTSRGVTVTRTGWVEPLEGTPGRRRHMTDEALATLERLLLQSGLTRAGLRKDSATRDGYSYEIAARVGGKLRHVELSDPVPDEQERLVRVLSRLLPRE